MKKTIQLIIVCAFSLSPANADQTYTGSIVTLTADPAVTFDEKPHKFTAIKLNKPKSITALNIDDESKTYLNVAYIQLVDSKNQSKLFLNNNKPVNLICSDIFTAHTGYHYTDILCTVKNIK